eukprot:314525-Chlamydomonas_euryale.AAC.1
MLIAKHGCLLVDVDRHPGEARAGGAAPVTVEQATPLGWPPAGGARVDCCHPRHRDCERGNVQVRHQPGCVAGAGERPFAKCLCTLQRFGV